MVTVPNSLSMNAVNFQKAKSAPKVIAKNISPKITQTKWAVMWELWELSDKEYQFIKQSKDAGLTKEEAVAYIQEKRKPTLIQKVAQVGKDLAGWTLAGFSTLPTNIVWWALKWLWNVPITPWLNLPKTPMQESLVRTWENIQRSWERTAAQNIDITGAQPLSTATSVWKAVAPLATAIVWGAATGLTKAWAWAISQVWKWLAQRSIPTVLKWLWTAWAVWAWEQAIYDVASQGETSPESLAVWWLLWTAWAWVIAWAPLLAKPIWKALSKLKPTGEWTNKFAEGLVASTFKNPAMREKYISKVWQAPEVTLLEWGIKGTLKQQTEEVLKRGKASFDLARQSAKAIPETIASPEWKWIADKILEWVDTTIPWIVQKTAPIREMWERFAKWTATADDLIQAKTYLTRYEQIYDDFGRVKKTGDQFEKEALANMYTTMKNQLEDLWRKYWVDFETINKETMKYEWLRGIMTRAISREANRDLLWLSDYVLWWVGSVVDPVSTLALLATKKVLQSPNVASRIANAIYKKAKPLSKTIKNDIHNTMSRSVNSVADEVVWRAIKAPALPLKASQQITPKWVIQKVPEVNPPTRLRKITETGMENVKQPTTAKISERTVAPKTPLQQAKKTAPSKPTIVADSKKLSPKAPKALQTPTAMSKVDDTLSPTGKMEIPKKLSAFWWVEWVKPTNQLKYNQWQNYEAVRLVVNDQDAMASRYWALRTKDMKALSWWTKLTEWEKLEMKRIVEELWGDAKKVNERAERLKEQAKKVRSSSEQKILEINDNFREQANKTK